MQSETWDQDLLEDISAAMIDASICGLGQAAPNPIRLTIEHFADEI
jgi:formate dehydrogenase